MKNRIRSFSAALSCIALSVPCHAASLTWDADPNNAAADDGGGTWNTTATNWWDGIANVFWNSGTPDDAIFGNGGAAGTVSLGEAVSVANLTFAGVGSGSYTIQSNTLTLVGTPTITATANGTINSVLSGSGFNKSGGGRLTLTGNNAGITGDVTIASGVLQAGGVIGTQYPNALGANAATRSVFINSGATLDLIGRDILGAATPMTVNGTVTNNGFSRFGPLTLGGATIRSGVGNSATYQNYTLESSVTVTGSTPSYIVGAPRTLYSAIHLEPAGRVNVNVADVTGNADADLVVTSHLMDRTNNQGPGGLNKSGAGTLSLANNTARGEANVAAGTIVITNGSWGGAVVISNGAQVVAQGGHGLMGQYFNVSPPNVGNRQPNYFSFTNAFTYLATQNVNTLFGSAHAGDNFDFNSAGTNFPPGYFPGGANFQTRWIGKINIATAGIYYFDTASDDGSMLFVDGQRVVDNNYFQGVVTRSGTIYLTAGLHDIMILFYQGGGGYGMYADMTLLGGTVARISNSVLSSAPGIGSLSGEAGGSLAISNGQLTVAQSTAGTFGGTISGNGGMYKIGTAQLTLAGASTYSGETTIAGGTLALADAGGISNSASISLLGGTLDVTAIPGYTVRAGQPFGGFGVVSGAIAVAGGAKFQPGGHRVAGTMEFSSDLTLSSGTTNYVDLSATAGYAGLNDGLFVNGNLTVGGPLVVSLVGGGSFAAGPYNLAIYMGSLSGTFSAISGGNTRATFGVDYGSGLGGTIDLYPTNTPASLRWNGTGSALWDVAASANWYNLGSLAADAFLQNDDVLFDDTTGVQTNVAITEPVSPGVLLVSNATQQFTFSGNKITGPTVVNKAGAGLLILSNATPNDFTGVLNVSGGAVRVAAVGVLGPNNGTINVANGGQVQLNGVAQAAYSYIHKIAGSGPDGRGAIMNTNASIGTGSTVKWLELTADASVGSYGLTTAENARFDIGSGGGVQGNGFTLTKVGNNVVPMRGSATNLQMIVSEGFVYGEQVNDPFGSNVVVQAGAYLGGYASARTFNVPVTLNGGTLSARAGGGAPTWTGPVSVPTNSFLTTAPGVYGYGTDALNVNGSISGNGGLTIYGNSTTTFRGTNTYAGQTILRNAGGTLSLATADGNAIAGPVQLGHQLDGGGQALLLISTPGNKFAPGVGITLQGSPNDFAWIRLLGTTQYVASVNTDDNGGGVLDNVYQENGYGDARLVVTGSGDSLWSGHYLRDKDVAATNTAGKLTIVQAGSGTLALAGGSQFTTFSGGVIVSNGSLNLKSQYAAGRGTITLAGGDLALDGFGLKEGSIAQAGLNTTSPCPLNTSVKLGTPRPNRGSNGAADFGGNTTWVYSGYLVVTNDAPVSYTFGENIDDNGWLQIDGVQVLNDGTWNVPTIGTITLAPGLHRFDFRAYNGGGGSGAQTQGGWTNTLGFGIDRLGRHQNLFTNFTEVIDAGDGKFLCTDVTVTNDILLAAQTRVKVSNRVGPTNTIASTIGDDFVGYGLTKIGEGSLALSGTSIYFGPTIVSNGVLYMNGASYGPGTVTVLTNATLGGTGTFFGAAAVVESGGRIGEGIDGLVGSLTVAGGIALNDGARVACQLNGSIPTLVTTAAVTSAASNPVEIYSKTAITLGSYALIQYGSLDGTGFASYSLVQPLPNGAQGFLSNNIVNSTIDLVVTNAGSGVRWMGAVDNLWAADGKLNWQLLLDSSPAAFSPFSAVLLDDLLTGSSTVKLSEAISAGGITVDNSATTYHLSGLNGSGFLTGTGGLLKDGTGTLFLAITNNNYTGATVVNDGSIVVGAFRPFGFTPSVTVNAGGQVNLNGISQAGVGYNWTIVGDGPGGAGAIVNTGAAIMANSSISNLTLTGNATIAIHGPGNNDAGRTDLCIGGTLNGNGYQITKTGLSQLNFRGVTIGLTNILVNEGIAVSENVNNSLGSNVFVQSGAKVAGYGGVTNAANVQLNGGTLTTWGGAPCAWNGTFTLLADSFINNNPGVGYGNVDVIINGSITGPGGFTKMSGQAVTLNATNDYAGATIIAGGGGTIVLGAGDNTLPVTTDLSIHGSDTGSSVLNMSNLNQTVASLSGTNTYGNAILLGSGTLTVNGSGSGDYFGKILGSGGLVRSGTGTLILNNGSNTFSGGTTVNSGTLAVRHHDAAGVGTVAMNGGTLSLDAAGLWEGRVTGNFNRVSANPKWAANLTTEKLNSTVIQVYPDNTTYVYSGYLNVTGDAPVTWSFVKRFDDGGWLSIDGVVLIDQYGWDQTIVATTTLSPGLHAFEVRMGEGAGGIGPTAGWPIGFGYDPLGRGQAEITNFIQMVDLGDGSLFRRDDLVFTNVVTLSGDCVISAPVALMKTGISGPIGGTAGFTKTGVGALILSGANTYAGNTVVSNGALFVNGANAGAGAVTVVNDAQVWGSGSIAGAVTVQAGGIIGARQGVTNAGVTLTMPSLTLDTGAIVGGYLNGTNPTISVTGAGALSIGASNLVQIVPSAPIALGTYPLIAYNTGLGGSGFGGLVLGTLPNGAQGYLNNNTGLGMIELVVTNAGGGLKWYGSAGNGDWDVLATANWAALPAAVSATFQNFDAVIFDDTATNFNVSVTAAVNPAGVTVSNETQDYVIGDMAIRGSGGLVKYGAAKLALASPNLFTGATVINGGTVAIAADNYLGTVPATFTPAHLRLSGGTIEATTNFTFAGNRGIGVGPDSGAGAGTIAVVSGATLTVSSVVSNTPGGTGELVKTGQGTLVVTATARHTGGTTVNEGTLQLNVGNNVGTLGGGSNLTINSGGRVLGNATDALGYYNNGSVTNININGTGILTINVGSRYSVDQTINMAGGVLTSVGTGDAGNAGITYSLRNSHGGVYNFTSATDGVPAVVSAYNVGLNDGQVAFNVAKGGGPVDLYVTSTLRNNFAAGGLTKNGDGVMVLAGTNTYTLPTIINGGILVVGDGNSGSLGTDTGAIADDGALAYYLPGTVTVNNVISGTGVVAQIGSGTLVLHGVSTYSGGTVVSSGVLMVNGSVGAGDVAVAAGATLGGTGTVAGAVISDGSVAPGASAGTLTLSSDYTQNAGGSLNIELGGISQGVDYDYLGIAGAATLGGTLNVTFINGFTGTVGDVFVFLNAGTGVSGTFATTNLPAPPAGGAWDLQYLGTFVMLSIVSGPAPGGYDLYAGQIPNPADRGYQNDPDGDGYANLLEYATGGDPTNSDTVARMNAARTNGLLALKFTRNTNAVDATLFVEASYATTNDAIWTGIATNLAGSWGGAPNVTESGSGTPVDVTVADTDPAATNRFLRLRVTRP